MLNQPSPIGENPPPQINIPKAPPLPEKPIDRRMRDLGIEALLDNKSANECLNILMNKLGIESVRLQDTKRGKKKFKVKAGKQSTIRKASYDPQELRSGLNYLELFCLYAAQTKTKRNLFTDQKKVEPAIFNAINLIEKIRDNVDNEVITRKQDVTKLKELINHIYEETNLTVEQDYVLRASFEKARRMVSQTAKRVIITD